MNYLSAAERVARYLSLCPASVKAKRFLGGGTDGDVWETSAETAIKVFKYEHGYQNERDSYLRLQEFGVTEKIDGFWVPEIVGYHDELMIVEMDIVQDPPYIIDFAKVRLNNSPDFPEDTLAENNRRGIEIFEHNWPKVCSLLETLESFRIFYLDPQRGNITFPDMR